MATIYDMMQPCKLPGAQTTVVWNPTRLTKRMRNAVTKLIKSDQYGTWSSGAWKIARTLHQHIDAPYYRHKDRYTKMRLLKGDTTAVAYILEAVEAQQAVARLEGGFFNANWANQMIANYYKGKTQELFFYGDPGVCEALVSRLAGHYAFRRDQDNQRMLDILNSDQDIVVGSFTR